MQARQSSVQAWSQQTPSAQNVDAHSSGEAHAAPFPSRQRPLSSHAPLQLGSVAFVTVVHVPVAHVSHTAHADWQQTPTPMAHMDVSQLASVLHPPA